MGDLVSSLATQSMTWAGSFLLQFQPVIVVFVGVLVFGIIFRVVTRGR